MVEVNPISEKEEKYCTHCDKPASFELVAANLKVTFPHITACLCKECMEDLKRAVDRLCIKDSAQDV